MSFATSLDDALVREVAIREDLPHFTDGNPPRYESDGDVDDRAEHREEALQDRGDLDVTHYAAVIVDRKENDPTDDDGGNGDDVGDDEKSHFTDTSARATRINARRTP